MKKKIALLFSTVSLMVAGSAVGVSAQAGSDREAPIEIQTHDLNKDCAYTLFTTSGISYVAVPGTEVVVSTGYAVKDVVVEFSSEVHAAPGNRMDLKWSIDGGAPTIMGPSWFHVGNPYNLEETRTAVAVFQLKGKHTIRPMIRSMNGSPVTSIFRCMVARLGPQ